MSIALEPLSKPIFLVLPSLYVHTYSNIFDEDNDNYYIIDPSCGMYVNAEKGMCHLMPRSYTPSSEPILVHAYNINSQYSVFRKRDALGQRICEMYNLKDNKAIPNCTVYDGGPIIEKTMLKLYMDNKSHKCNIFLIDHDKTLPAELTSINDFGNSILKIIAERYNNIDCGYILEIGKVEERDKLANYLYSILESCTQLKKIIPIGVARIITDYCTLVCDSLYDPKNMGFPSNIY